MYAIVNIAGQQFKVSKDMRLKVHRLQAEEGKVLELDQVLLVNSDSGIVVGTPTVEGARVAAQVLAHSKGDKVLVFHKKRRKGYSKMNGHRQALTELQILGILGKGEKAPSAIARKTPKPKAEAAEDVSTEAETPKKTPKTTAKKEAAPKKTEKKAPTKKAAPKKDTKKK